MGFDLGGMMRAHDYPLWYMAEGVAVYPTGRDAQLLTRVIHHVRHVSGNRNVLLSQVQQYAAQHGITVPPADVIQPNVNVVAGDTPSRAFLGLIEADYLRKFGHRSSEI